MIQPCCSSKAVLLEIEIEEFSIFREERLKTEPSSSVLRRLELPVGSAISKAGIRPNKINKIKTAIFKKCGKSLAVVITVNKICRIRF